MPARKSSGKTAKKTPRKAGRRTAKGRSAIERFEEEVLSADLRAVSRRMRRGLGKLERNLAPFLAQG